MKMFLVSGVPLAMQQDGWWMSEEAGASGPQPTIQAQKKPDFGQARLAFLVGLVALGDVLIWQVTPGVSLAVFFLAVLAAGLLMLRPARSRRQIIWAGCIGLVALAPLIEQVQALSVMIALVGVSISVVTATIGWAGLATGVLRLWMALPLRLVLDTKKAISQGVGAPGLKRGIGRMILQWTLPVTFGGAFLGLLVEANPMMDGWVQSLSVIDLTGPGWGRMLFWLGMTALIWPMLVLSGMTHQMRLPFGAPAQRDVSGPSLVNADAVVRSLLVFNGLFAVQSLMDMTYLWGGAVLPEGMSYAEYAHRGAYPLVATALLAGAFAMLSRPFAGQSRLLYCCLMAFLVQNVFLVSSSLLRLELYIDTYGLTRLRMAAIIWMGLVALGLCLIAWQIWRQHSNAWLVSRLAISAGLVLYICAFISFDATIARHNLASTTSHSAYYLCHLGPAALPVLAEHEVTHAVSLCRGQYRPKMPVHVDWREWGFRDWRVLRSLSEIQARTLTP